MSFSASARLMEELTPLLARIEQFELDREPSLEGQGPERSLPLLKMALRNELEASDIAARWLAETPVAGLKLALARQVGDEARHYGLIQHRLKELGHDTTSHDPWAEGKSPLYVWLLDLKTDAERVAAGPFAREALACAKNRQFIRACRAWGDTATARLYEEQINPDEGFHHELGKTWVDRLVQDEEAYQAALAAVRGVLKVAEEVQEVLQAKKCLTHTPGC